MKRCPYCDEEVRDNAIKCKHCGSILGNADTLDAARTERGERRQSPDDTLDREKTIFGDQLFDGQLLARQYRIIGNEPLGSGGMGEVWKATDIELGTSIAIKVLPPVMARDKEAIENLKHEAMIGQQLTHPNICRLYGFHTEGNLKFIVMEYINGQTLKELLAQQEDRKLSWEELEPTALQVAAALDYAHNATYKDASGRMVKGVLHRDIKLANIMITEDDQAKLMDFGIAREIHNTMTQLTGRTSQTPMYASPEQFKGEQMTAASDIYSFTAVLYECLAGHPLVSPHGDLSYQILQREFEPLASQSQIINKALETGLSKKTQDRPNTAKGLVHLTKTELAARPEREPVVAVAPFGAQKAKEYQKLTAEALRVPVEKTIELGKGIKMEFVLIPSGEFIMGSPSNEEGRDRDEGPQHRVRISKGFYMGQTEVTQSQWRSVMSTKPSRFKGNNLPVEQVPWNDAVEFCKKLSQRKGKTYRLPTEAEWEYACRAGTSTPFNTGSTISTSQANYNGNFTYGSGQKGVDRQKTTEVGSFAPNSFGLYDMHGNVWEWCSDWYDIRVPTSHPALPQRISCGSGQT